jgi:5-methylcytosine-specific restriction protein A
MTTKSGSGKELNVEWKVGAQHALYHHSGNWYHVLERFPGAFFDKNGYVLFHSKRHFESCEDLRIGKHVTVPEGISQLREYVPVRTR